MKFVGLLLLVLILVQSMRVFMLYRQRPAYKAYWQNLANVPVPENALVYVALGDSAAQGIGASRPQNGYVGLVAKKLQQKTARAVHITNLSVTGARLRDVIDKQVPALQNMELPKDAVVTLAIGSNNIRSYNGMDFKTSMDKILSRVPPQTVVGDIPYFGGGRATSGEKSALEASTIIAELTTKYKLRLAPLHEVTKEGNSFRNFAPDLFHPNDRGYKLWADAFWQALRHDAGI